jgi:hypothetical protein
MPALSPFAVPIAGTVSTSRRLLADRSVRGLWARVMDRFVEETAAAIEAERARGAALPGVPARDLATALNWMNERVLQATFEGDDPSIGEDAVLDTLAEVWLRAIYGTTEPPAG